jgi:hypothetical protein
MIRPVVLALLLVGCGVRAEDVVAFVGELDAGVLPPDSDLPPDSGATHDRTPGADGAAAGPLDLELWNPGAVVNELRFAVRITNWGAAPVALARLSVKVWFDHGGADPLEASSDDEAMTLYGPDGTWRSNLGPTRVAFARVTPVKDCGGGRRASRAATITFAVADGTLDLEPGGGHVACNHDTNAMATWHRTDWAQLVVSQDYSRVADAGSTSATRSNLRQFTLYLDGQLVAESLDATTPDPETGVEPCP